MLDILSLGVYIACISCLCCLCTATVVAAPGILDLRTGLFLCRKRQCDETGRKSESVFSSDKKETISPREESTIEDISSETCPCTIYVLDPILRSRDTNEICTSAKKTRKSCRCPSFLDLVGDPVKSPPKILPRN